MEDIESKLDLLIDLYKDDRRILLQQHASNQESSNLETQNAKPRSILIDKQYVSEPSTPILEKHPSKVMLRNHSDLSSRIRKRVTYRLQTPGKSPIQSEPHILDTLGNRKNELEGRHLESIKSCSLDNEVLEGESGEVFKREPIDTKRVKVEVANISGTEPMSGINALSDSSSTAKIVGNSPRNIVKLSETRQRHCGDSDESCNIVQESNENSEVDRQSDNVAEDHQINIGNGAGTQDAIPVNEKSSPSDHVILMPIGTIQALAADSSDV